MSYRIPSVGRKLWRRFRSSRRAESETTGGPTENPAQTALSVIQAGMAMAFPFGDSQTTQSPSWRRILRTTGRLFPNRSSHR